MLQKVLDYFKQISKIPRCSGNEKKIAEYLVAWANNNNYEYKQDNIGNVLIIVPATVGMEKKETIVLQGHMDMVCVKSDDSNHDFSCDGIEIIEENGFLKANNTTLGADNGIGIALALTASHFEKHPKLELFFTVDEEVGMSGALNIQNNFLSGKKLLNIDSEGENEITIGSAGGARIKISDNYELLDGKFNKYEILISGLKGGHSGIEIDKSKGNAAICLILLLKFLGGDFEFYNIDSGVADNVIPKQLLGVIGIEKDESLLEKINIFKKEYIEKFDEMTLKINVKKINQDIKTIGIESSKKILDAILNCNNGVYSYSQVIEGFVQTSQNLGIIKLDSGKLLIKYLMRSSKNEELDILIQQKNKYFSNFAEINLENRYPGWKENKDSKLLNQISQIYKKYFGEKFEILGAHAGLECGAIISKMSIGSEAVSIGPNIYGAHTIEEKCEINSIGILCKILEDFLKEL